MADFNARRVTMVDTQVRPNDVTRFPVIESMLTVAREDFVPPASREVAYSGENIALGQGRVLLEPRSFAKMIDALNIQPSDLVLDVACGLGYSTAVLARMAQAVVGLESDATLAEGAQAALTAAEVMNAAIVQGDLVAGYAKQAPYDAIMVNGAAEEIPSSLTDQLKEGGRIAAIFLQDRLGVARIGHRIDDRIHWRFAFNAHAPVLPGFGAAKAFAL